MDGVAVKPLTVGFHETEFLEKLNGENQFSFWFQLSGKQRQQVGSPWGPSNPQSLNRYSYVQNNPLRWTDPTGHCSSVPALDMGCFNKAKAIILSSKASWQDKAAAIAYVNATHALVAAGTALAYVAGMAVAATTVEATLTGPAAASANDIANKYHHVFDRPGHQLSGLVKAFGSEEKAFNAVYNNFAKTASQYTAAQLAKGIQVTVGGQTVTVRGAMVNGVPRVGTFFIE